MMMVDDGDEYDNFYGAITQHMPLHDNGDDADNGWGFW